MELTLRDGRMGVGSSEVEVELQGLRPEVIFWQGGRRHVWRPLLQSLPSGGWGASPADGPLALELHAAAEDRALVLHLTLRHVGEEELQLDRVVVLASGQRSGFRVGPNPAGWGVFRNGYQSWTGTRGFRAGEVDRDPPTEWLRVGLIDLRNPSPGEPGCFRGDLVAAVRHETTGDTMVAGFLDGREAFAGIRIDAGAAPRFEAAVDTDGVPFLPGDEFVAPPLWLAAGGDGHALLEAWATASGAAMEARVPARNPLGWCSWYYYFTRIDEPAILANLEAAVALRERFPCDYFQIDDGYQAAIGDWLEPNGKFPRGMGALAADVRAAGFDAGIWTAPFLAGSGSRLFREHPGWFVRDESGRPRFALWNPMWGWRRCYALDTTHPEVLDWLRATFRTIVHDWGYRVLKLDFLYAAALPGQRHDREATRAQALRRGLEAIREAAGEEAFLLGCGSPLGPAVGVVDAMRIGPDVAPFWDNLVSRTLQRGQHGVATRHAVRNTLTRAFLHGRWWRNDPDCLMVRDARTSLTPDEVQTLATAIAVTDGMIVVSDNLSDLSPAALERLGRVQELAGGVPEVHDLFRDDIPETLVSRAPGRTVVAAFNFADEPRPRLLDLAALGMNVGNEPWLREFWSGEAVPVVDGVLNLGVLPPHASRVFVLPAR